MKERPSKRFRLTSPPNPEDEALDLDAMEVFRRHFESRFESIHETTAVAPPKSSDSMIDEGSDAEDKEWNGISGSEESESGADTVQVVHHSSSAGIQPSQMSKRELKAFMSSKPPTSVSALPPPAPAPAVDVGDNDAENLHNDLALQRLLRESHLLNSNAEKLEATGAQRLKALHLRIEALGGKRITNQKMSLEAKRGIEGKKVEREKKRRRDAREAGIVLEKEEKVVKVRKKGTMAGKGLGSLDAPSAGKFKGGALVLSKKDVRDIMGSGEGRGGKSRQGRGRGRK